MNTLPGKGACGKCNCHMFLSSDPFGLIDDVYMTGRYLVKPSRRCRCGHKDGVHIVPIPGYGALATCFIDGVHHVVPCLAQYSQMEAEEGVLRNCIESGGSDPVVRICGFQTYLALARAENDRLGWAGGENRAAVERLAVKYCGDPKRPRSVYSIQSQHGNPHVHFREPYCKK